MESKIPVISDETEKIYIDVTGNKTISIHFLHDKGRELFLKIKNTKDKSKIYIN
jgi:hypothetical protein